MPTIANAAKIGLSPAPAPKATTLDKGVEWAKENTKDGTFVGDHYMLAGGAAIVGTTATIAGVAKLADKVPLIEKAVDFTFRQNGEVLGAAASLGAAYVLAEDGVQSLKEGSKIKGGAELLGAGVATLGGAELVGERFNIPVLKDAISGPARFVRDNALAVSGGAAAAGGAALAVKGAKDLKDGKTIQGALEVTAGTIGVAGGGELIGRQYNIPVLKSALSGPFKAVFGNTGMSKVVGGGAAGLVGAGAAADGVRRLSQDKGLVNDLIGVAEVTGGVTGVTGGVSLVGMGLKNDALARALPNNLKVVAGVGMVAGSVALAKHTVKDIKNNGVGLINTATGTGATLLALGGTQQVAEKLGVPMLNNAFDKAWKPVLGVGLGIATYKFGANALKEGKSFIDDPTAGKAFNAGGQALLATLSGAGSAALVGGSLGIPVLENAGEKVLTTVGENVLAPVFKAATKNPFVTLGVVAAATGAGYYIYSKTKDDK